MRDRGASLCGENLRQLASDGYTILPQIVAPGAIALFETQIAAVVSEQTARLGLAPAQADPFIDLFSVGEDYARRLYSLMERMQVLHAMAFAIGNALGEDGFFAHFGMKSPLVWPDIRADLPFGDQILPVHQDYKSTLCRKAFRIWMPLRTADAHHGTICIFRGSHAMGPTAHDAREHDQPAIARDLHNRFERVVLELPPGDGLLIDPLLFHESVPNRSERTKFTLMVQIQDLASMIDPRDPAYATFARARYAREPDQAAPPVCMASS